MLPLKTALSCGQFMAALVFSSQYVLGSEVSGDAALARKCASVLHAAIEGQIVVGAQLTIGDAKGVVHSASFGRRIHNGKPVNENTLFCIGSCSKPLAALVLLRLADEGELDLDDGVSVFVPELNNLRVVDGQRPGRAPTLRELLAHRGGLYSQEKTLTERQRRAIRDYTLTLGESVKMIAEEPLSAAPGTEFAYSGAGYCVVGRAAERAASASFESLLRGRLCAPLRMQRTTYFPKDDENIALPGASKLATETFSQGPISSAMTNV